MKSDKPEIAVIGAGGAGTMAYLRSVLNYDKAIIFTGDADNKRKGRATWVAEVDNIPGMHDVKKPITSTHNQTIKWLKTQEGLKDMGTVIKGSVTDVSKTDSGFSIKYTEKKEEKELEVKYVILATGIMDKQPEIAGSIQPILPFANKGDVLYCMRCDGHKAANHKLSIIGDDETALHIGFIMHERYGNENITILTNGKKVEFSEKYFNLAKKYGFEFNEQPIVEVLGSIKENGLEGYKLEDGSVIDSTRSIVSLGIIAYNQLLKKLGGEISDNGRVVVNEKFESSIENFFVVGDLVANKKMQIYTAWDQAVDAADEINKRIRNEFRNKHL